MKNSIVRISIFVLAWFVACPAMAKLPLMAGLAGNRELPKSYSVSIDYFNLEQSYQLDTLSFEFRGLSVGNPSDLEINSKTDYVDLKFGVWIVCF